MSEATGRSRRLDALQALRGIAAMMVVFFHLKYYTVPDVLGLGDPLWRGFSMGYAGVEIFFVLSGFIMVFVHRGDFGVPGRMGAFLWKRVVRIYPVLWAVLIATIAARYVLNGVLPSGEAALAAFTLWPDFGEPIIEVAWSLSFEMLFYLIFALAILSLPLGIAVGAVWFGATALAVVTGYQGPGAAFLLSPYNLLFLFGMAAAYGYGRLGGAAWAALLAGAGLFLTVGMLEAHRVVDWNNALRTVLYGIGATGIVAGVAALDAAGRLTTPRWLSFLGDASYSIYLVHIMAMTFAAKVLAGIGLVAALPVWLTAGLLAIGAAVAGVIVHLVVEKPVLRYLRRGGGAVPGGTPA